jgi:hypothetical protein
MTNPYSAIEQRILAACEASSVVEKRNITGLARYIDVPASLISP